VIGPSVGGALYAVHPALPFAADAASYLVSLGLVLVLQLTTPQVRRARGTGYRTGPDVTAWRWLRSRRRLWWAAWWSGALTATFAAVGFVLLTLARSRGATPSELGVMYTMSAAGGVVGALLTTRLLRRHPGERVLVAAAWLDAAAASCLLPDQSPYVTGALGFAAFLLVPAVASVLLGRLATECPEPLVGRAQATLTLIMGAAAPAAAPAIGLLVDGSGPRFAVGVCAAAFIGLAAAASAASVLGFGQRASRACRVP
jgi:predicted MFS family arabinose efflux permease